jgi:hypothetical protein
MSQKQSTDAIKAALPQLNELALALAVESKSMAAAKATRKAAFAAIVPELAMAFEKAGVTRNEVDAPIEALIRAAYGVAKGIALTGAARQAKRRLLDALFGAVKVEWEIADEWIEAGRALAAELFGHEADGKPCHAQLWAAVGSSLFAEMEEKAKNGPKKSKK